jgi:uncharacterized protein YeaO (DUF488 family)
MKNLRIGRVYEPVDPNGGQRVLVDRLWPRGLRKEDAHLDLWCKDVAPSTELRRFYGHRPERFEEFASRYKGELHNPQAAAAVHELLRLARGGTVTLLTASRDLNASGAAVLAAHLSGIRSRPRKGEPDPRR